MGVSVQVAETLGAWSAALSWKWAPRKLGSKGSRWVLQWINTKRGNGGYSDSLAHDMSVWINLLEEFRCSYIMREGRMAADFIAGVGSKGTVVQYAQDTNRYV